jgi:hypothetical protein
MSAPVDHGFSQRLFRLVAREWGTVLFTAAAIVFFIGAFDLRGQAGYFPMGVSSVTVLFGLSILTLELRNTAQDAPATGEADEWEWNRRTFLTIGWFAFALAVTYIFGIVIAAAIAAPIYFWLLTSLGRAYALVNGLAISLFIWVVFKQLAGLPLYEGMF